MFPCSHKAMYDIITITVNYKMKEKVMRMLRSLYHDIDGVGLKIESVVIDNNSLDGIEQALARDFPRAHCLINSKNIGFGSANNIAFNKFASKYYFIINPDIIFPENQQVIKRLYDFMEKYQPIGIAAPKLILENNIVQPSCMRFPAFWDQPFYRLELHKKYAKIKKQVEKLLMMDFDHDKILPVDWCTGAALFIRGSVLRQTGFFDERFFMYFEDCDLCRNFWQAGWPVYYKGDVSLFHGHERASAKIPGISSIFRNKLTRIHLYSLLKYWWKWRWER